jgi:hypothetical protein
MPDAFSMNSGDDGLSAGCVPAAIAAAFFSFSRRTYSLKATHSSSFSRTCSGCQTPEPVIAVEVVRRGDDMRRN